MTIKIDSNVPLPQGKRGGAKNAKYPWADMKVGDSFFVPKEQLPGRGRSSLSIMAGQNLGKGNYRTGIENDGVRVWKIK